MDDLTSNMTLKVTVRSRQGLVFEGELGAVSSYNQKGPFDVLPLHTNFVTMISKRVVLHRADGKREEIIVDNGVLLVEKNEVKVFLGVSKV
ncbi:MAG: seg [Candidatus Amesbacteria bacterium GW2011_GWC1_47_15]|uniref:Seg n=2 Tax=Candidatus Amesiibacteriota TaxID=1752730 RepID=A0A0G1UB13_9BACT|nr:MAG: seg [Candidatus Amesbacteria bacterium GW2011_GWC1_47_15]